MTVRNDSAATCPRCGRENFEIAESEGVCGWCDYPDEPTAACEQTPEEIRASIDFARIYREGDRCQVCGHWYWASDGEGWHSLVPITYADTPELARPTYCPSHDAGGLANDGFPI